MLERFHFQNCQLLYNSYGAWIEYKCCLNVSEVRIVGVEVGYSFKNKAWLKGFVVYSRMYLPLSHCCATDTTKARYSSLSPKSMSLTLTIDALSTMQLWSLIYLCWVFYISQLTILGAARRLGFPFFASSSETLKKKTRDFENTQACVN